MGAAVNGGGVSVGKVAGTTVDVGGGGVAGVDVVIGAGGIAVAGSAP